MFLVHSLWAIVSLVFAINVPFGFWRAGLRKFSARWFLAVHVPVVLAIGLRLLAGIPLRIVTLPAFAGAFFLGQALGGRLKAGGAPKSG